MPPLQSPPRTTHQATHQANPGAARFWNAVARRYAARAVSNPLAYEETLDRTRAYLRATDSVLEIGCGTAATAVRLAPAVARYTASDIASEMIAIGRERQQAAGLDNLSLVQGGLSDPAGDDPSLGEGPFDAVLAFNMLHLTRDRTAQARVIHARLKPGGLFISKTVCLANRHWALMPLVGAMRMIGKAPWIGFLSKSGLERQIAAAGFEIVETADFPARSASHFIVARRV